jgi:hypothetical protein
MTELVYTIDGKDTNFSIREDLELKHKNLYLGEEKVFDIFRRQPNVINGKSTFNDIDITKFGRELFNIPDEFTNHFTSVTIRG